MSPGDLLVLCQRIISRLDIAQAVGKNAGLIQIQDQGLHLQQIAFLLEGQRANGQLIASQVDPTITNIVIRPTCMRIMQGHSSEIVKSICSQSSSATCVL